MRVPWRRVVCGLAVAALWAPAPAAAAASLPAGAYAAAAEGLFSRSLQAYRSGEFEAAALQLRRLCDPPVNQRTSAALLLLSQAQFHLGDYHGALQSAQLLEYRFGASRYVPYARLVAGDSYCARKRYRDAAFMYSRALSASAPLPLQARVAERLAALVANAAIGPGELEGVRADIGPQRLQEALLYGRARWYGRLGWTAAAAAAAQAYADSLPGGAFAELLPAAALADADQREPLAGLAPQTPGAALPAPVSAPRPAAGPPRVGLLLPLTGTGFGSQVAADLEAGVRLANEQLGAPFELVVADIGADYGDVPIVESDASRLLRIALQTRRLIDEEGVVAVVGPVFSSDCVVAGVVADASGVPLLAPLAEQGDLDQVGSGLFQLGTVPAAQGSALGRYAAAMVGLRRLAVVAPLTDYGWAFAQAFTRAAQDYGAQIVGSDWYVPEATTDFRRVFEQIRTSAGQVAVAERQSVAGSEPASMDADASPPSLPAPAVAASTRDGSAEDLTGEGWAVAPDADSAAVAVDGIAIVVESFSDARIIAPQLRYHRFDALILGNDAWDDPAAIQQMRPADRACLDGTLLVAARSDEDEAQRRFAADFRHRYRREPGYAAAGYDAAMLLGEAWAQGRRGRAELRAWLAGVEGYRGASGRLSFRGGRRTNGELTLLRIDAEGRIRQVREDEMPELADRRPRPWPVPDAPWPVPGGAAVPTPPAD